MEVRRLRNDELAHYGVKGMKWENHKYVTPEEIERRRKAANKNKQEQASRERQKEWCATNRKNDAWRPVQRKYLKEKHGVDYNKDSEINYRNAMESKAKKESEIKSKHYSSAREARQYAKTKEEKIELTKEINKQKAAERKTDWDKSAQDRRVASNVEWRRSMTKRQEQLAKESAITRKDIRNDQKKILSDIENTKKGIAESKKKIEEGQKKQKELENDKKQDEAIKTYKKVENTKPVKALRKIQNKMLNYAKSEKGKKKINKLLKKLSD